MATIPIWTIRVMTQVVNGEDIDARNGIITTMKQILIYRLEYI